MQRAALIVNPSKFDDAASLRPQITDLFRRHGEPEPLFYETSLDDPGQGQARQALAEGATLLCPLGGDGTVRAVAETLIGVDAALGIVPAGTGNLLARNLGLPVRRDPAAAVRRVLLGRDRQIDVGRIAVDRTGDGSDLSEHVFLIMCGLGLEAEMLAGTPERLKSRIGWPAYVASGARFVWRPTVRTRVVVDGTDLGSKPTTTVLVGNCGRLTGGVRLMPWAQFDDGLLDGVWMSADNLRQWGGLVLSVLTGRNDGARVHHLPGRSFEIRADEARTVQVDGDILGQAVGISVRIEPGALRVRVP